MADPSSLSKEDFKKELSRYGIHGPITQSTRPILEKKLIKLRRESSTSSTNSRNNVNSSASRSPARNFSTNTKVSISTTNATSSNLNTSKIISSNPLIAREMGGKCQTNTLRNKSKSPSRTTPKKDILKQLEMLKEFSRNDPISIPKEVSYSPHRKPNEPVFKSPNSIPYQAKRNRTATDLFESVPYSKHLSGDSILNKRTIRDIPQTFDSSNDYPGTERRRFPDSFYGSKIDSSNIKVKSGSSYIKYALWFVVFVIALFVILELNIDINRQRDILITSCYNTFSFVFNYAVFPVVMIGLIVIIITTTYLSVKFYRNKKFKEVKQIKETAEKIMGYLTSKNSLKPVGIPEYELFDEVFPKMTRTKRDKTIFEGALEYLFETEINIRYEIHDYDGVETKIYFWTTPLREKWQGSAVGTSNGVNLPRHGLANCLKIRGISMKNINGKDQEIMNDIRMRCIPYKILDMQIMTDMKDVVLYMKLKSNDEANKVFHLLHSHWFNGDLLNCKFLEETKYNQRFKI